jgi:hypothetical protein
MLYHFDEHFGGSLSVCDILWYNNYKRNSGGIIMAFPGMLELTEEQTQQLVNIIEEKQSCACEVANSMHTVWITSDDGENELRVAFLGRFALVISRVGFENKRRGTMTALLSVLKEICESYGVHRIIMQSVLTKEMEAFCRKSGFTPDKNSTMEVDGVLIGDYFLDF